MPERVHFVADNHFGHWRQACKRGFSPNHFDYDMIKMGLMDPEVGSRACREMNNFMIDRWNKVVRKNDRVYCGGDLFMGRTADAIETAYQLNGRIYLLRGNHDKIAEHKSVVERFEWVRDYAGFSIHGQRIYMCHYAFRTWNRMHHGSWNLHGHSHGSLKEISGLKQLDIGVDCHNFYPIEFEQVKAIMDAKGPFVPVDHHGSDEE